MVTEQRRAIAGVSRHDVQQDLPRGEGRAGNGGEERDGIVAGARPEADVESRPHRQHRELDPLEQAERTGKFAEYELCRKGDRKNQRNGVKAERIEGQGERSSNGELRTTASEHRWRRGDGSTRTRRVYGSTVI